MTCCNHVQQPTDQNEPYRDSEWHSYQGQQANQTEHVHIELPPLAWKRTFRQNNIEAGRHHPE